MRSLLLTVASLALILMPTGEAAGVATKVLGGGAKVDTQRLQRKIHKLSKAAASLKTASRGMNVQQAVTDAETLAQLDKLSSGCKSKVAGIIGGQALCAVGGASSTANNTAQAQSVFPTGIYETDAAAEQKWAEFENSNCYKQFVKPGSELVRKDQACYKEAVSVFGLDAIFEYLETAVLFEAMTKVKGSNKVRCGAMYSGVLRAGTCEDKKGAACGAAPYCRTIPASRIQGPDPSTNNPGNLLKIDHTCEADPAKAVEGACNGCFTKLGKALISAFPSAAAEYSFLALYDSSQCATTPDGQKCAAVLDANDAKYNGYPPSSSAGLDSYCKDPKMLRCLLKTWIPSITITKNDAIDDLHDCIDDLDGRASPTSCLNEFVDTIGVAKEGEAVLSLLCRKNAKGDYCLNQRYKLYTESNGCLNKAMSRQSCGSCAGNLTTLLGNMGCCAGTLQEASSFVQISLEDFPKELRGMFANQYSTRAELDKRVITYNGTVNVTAGEEEIEALATGFLDSFSACGVQNVNSTLSKGCKVVSYKAKRSMKLKIRWSSLQANATLKAQIKAGLKKDVATAAGLPEMAIVNDVIVEDTSVTVSGSRRRQNSNSGIRYEFEIETDDEALTNASAQNFDDAQTSNDGVVLTQTNVAVSECTVNCGDVAPEADGAPGVSVVSAAVAVMATLVLFAA